MILEPGTKILVAHRRLFEGDHGRYFTGVVDGYSDGIARITGHSWVRDAYRGTFERKADLRTKVVSLSSGTLIIYQLADSADLSSLKFCPEGTEVFLRDGRGFEMDMSESLGHAHETQRRTA